MSFISFLLSVVVALPGAPDDAAVTAAQLPLYPLTTCPISGEALGEMGRPVDVVVQGRLVRLCCGGCLKDLTADPAKAITDLDRAVIVAQTTTYPLKTCLVSGEPLGDQDAPLDVIRDGRLFRLCCKACLKELDKDLAASVAKLDSATIAAQLATYPLATCPISGEPLGDSAQNLLYGTTLVRLCCSDCKAKVVANPAPVLAKIAAARASASPAEGSKHLHERDGDASGHGEHDTDQGHGTHGSKPGHGAHDADGHDGGSQASAALGSMSGDQPAPHCGQSGSSCCGGT